MTGKRPKVKWSKIPPERWLPQALETLGLTEDQLTDVEFLFSWPNRKYWNPSEMGQDRIQGLMCNRASHKILEVIKGMRLRVLRQMYREVCRSEYGLWNKTFVIKMLCYKISDALGLMTPRMKSNYAELCQKKPDEVPDVYGHSWMYGKEVSGTGKPHRARQKKESKRKGPTIVSIIVECLRRDKGATKKQILDLLRQQFPARSPQAMRSTINVQLSYHLKKKYGDALKRDGETFSL